MLAEGVEYRGLGQYRARKLIGGVPVLKTFDTNQLAAEWLKRTEVQVNDGTFVDNSSLDSVNVVEVVRAFVETEMQIGGERRGAAEDLGHIPALRDGALGKLTLSKLTIVAVEAFKDGQKSEGFAPGTVSQAK